jgi:hypothetical protein
LLLFIAVQTFCCELVLLSVKSAKKHAEIVFRSSITEVRESEIVFHVDRVWKGRVPAVLVMPRIEWRGTPCMPGFYQDHIWVGTELLVYARKIPWLAVKGYVPEAGSRTKLTRDAAEDLQNSESATLRLLETKQPSASDNPQSRPPRNQYQRRGGRHASIEQPLRRSQEQSPARGVQSLAIAVFSGTMSFEGRKWSMLVVSGVRSLSLRRQSTSTSIRRSSASRK